MRSPRESYSDQKRHAGDRGIEWLLSYEDYLEIWLTSGKWFEKGRQPHNYCMCRYRDSGPYSRTNVFIDTVEENLRGRWEGKEVITNLKAKEIYDLYATGKWTQCAIACMYGVNQSYVSRIVNNKRKKTNEDTTD